jgi:hypothetical protein
LARPRAARHIIQSLFARPDGTLFVGTTTGIYFERQDGSLPDSPPGAGDGFLAADRKRLHRDCAGPGGDRGPQRRLSAARTAPDTWAAEPMHLEGSAIWSVLAAPGRRALVRLRRRSVPRANGKTTHLRAALHLPEEHWLHLLFWRATGTCGFAAPRTWAR